MCLKHSNHLQLSKLAHPIADKAKVTLFMARVDRIHPLASGNKYYKLKPSLEFAKQNKIKGLLSFGGAFSNHIHALALSAQDAGLESAGIIRGEMHYANNPTLSIAQKAGMHLEFINREDYRNKNNPDYLNDLQKRFPDYLIIPEGGSNQLGVAGCKEIAVEINRENTEQEFDNLLVASGTGATLAGLVCGAKVKQKVVGYSVLCDDSLVARVADFIKNENFHSPNYKIEQADFGGYAKLNKPLLDFILDWYHQTKIMLDPIYTSKLCMRLMQQIEAGAFKEGSRLCIVHTGGLQGWYGMEKRVIKLVGKEYWDKLESALK